MTLSELTVTVEVKRLSLWGRLRRLPEAFRKHYRVCRRENGVIASVYAAWLMAGMLITFRHDT